ncbi:MAG: ATP-binding protein [Deltaproteobacteria bacterium]|nr:ATP-binding protein [Deltaproteobacteria bacterium]
MKKRTQALRKNPANKIYFSLLGVALVASLAFWAGQYVYAVHLEAGNGSIQQMMWFSGILFSSLFLGGVGFIGLLFHYQAKQIQKLNDDQMKRMARVQNPDFLAMNAGDLILLLDPPLEASAKPRQAAEPLKAAAGPAPQGNPPGEPSAGSPVHSQPTPAPEDGMTVEEVGAGGSPTGVRFLYGNSRIAEVEGRKVYQSMIQDVEAAEREINEIERNQSKRRYRIVSEFAADWNYWQDLDKEMLYVSPACEDISGYPPPDFYKASDLLDSVIHPEDRPLWAAHNQEELAEKGPGHLEFRLFARDGEVRWVSHFCKPVHDPHGKFLGVCGSNRDITQQKRAEEAVGIKTQELLRSNAELEQFAYVASHDLQTPLRAISGYLNLLTKRYDGKLDADADRFIHRIHANVLRMQRLINDLLTYSRLTTRARPFQPTDCNQVVSEVLEMLQPIIEESGGRVTHEPLPTIPADSGQLLQLFQNLIGNAIKFRDHRPPEVHVDAQRTDKGWLFSVRDNGIGMDPQYGERIFLIFQRLHTMDQYPGTGIGLAICKKIVERHGGQIWVESKAGEGATFRFLIPDPGGNPA